jgi:predicted GNAT family N-acyltransferase
MIEKIIIYRPLEPGEEADICDLVVEIFDEFVALDYSEEGRQEFYRYADPEALAARQGKNHFCLVAEMDDIIVGVIEIRDCNHISLLFVKERGRGIAKELFHRALNRCIGELSKISQVTVNSSPYAAPIYKRIGFRIVDEEKTENGITYIPMAYSV